jgi:benzodiazapine receptor
MTMKLNRIILVISLALTLVVNFLANFLPLNELTTGEISDQFSIFFVPAGYVFSIWGLIYLALIAFIFHSITPKGLADRKIDTITGWFMAACLFNISWIFLWHYLQFIWTLIPIIGLLISLTAIYEKLRIGVEPRSFRETMLVSVPLGIYLGWMTVAVVANVSQVLFLVGWSGAPLNAPSWAAIMLGLASVIGVLMIFRRNEVAFPAVLIWSFIGIWVKHGDSLLVSITAMVLAMVLGVVTIWHEIFGRDRISS